MRPLYVQAEGDNTVPELERVIVAAGEKVIMASSLQEALEELTMSRLGALFSGIGGGAVGSEPASTDPGDGTASGTGGVEDAGGSDVEAGDSLPDGEVPEDVGSIVAELSRLQRATAVALSEDPADWREFGLIQARMQDLLDALLDALEGSVD